MKNKGPVIRSAVLGVLLIVLMVYFWRTNNRTHHNRLEGFWKVRKVTNDTRAWLYSMFYFSGDSLNVHANEHIREKSGWVEYKLHYEGKFKQNDTLIQWFRTMDTVEYIYEFSPPRTLELKQTGTRKSYTLEFQ